MGAHSTEGVKRQCSSEQSCINWWCRLEKDLIFIQVDAVRSTTTGDVIKSQVDDLIYTKDSRNHILNWILQVLQQLCSW